MIDVPRFPTDRLTAWGKALRWAVIGFHVMSQYTSISEKDLQSDLIPEESKDYQFGYRLGILAVNLGDFKVVRDTVDQAFDIHKRDLWFWFGVADGVLYFYSDSYKP